MSFISGVCILWKISQLLCCGLGGWLVAGFTHRRPGFKLVSGDVGFMVNKVALGQVFSQYFGSPCQSFHRLLHTHHPSSGTGSIGRIVADVPRGLSLTSTNQTTEKIPFFSY
jgi:hypothetical protein